MINSVFRRESECKVISYPNNGHRFTVSVPIYIHANNDKTCSINAKHFSGLISLTFRVPHVSASSFGRELTADQFRSQKTTQEVRKLWC